MNSTQQLPQFEFTKEQEKAFKINMHDGIQPDYALFIMYAVVFAMNHPDFQKEVGTFGLEYLEKIFTY